MLTCDPLKKKKGNKSRKDDWVVKTRDSYKSKDICGSVFLVGNFLFLSFSINYSIWININNSCIYFKFINNLGVIICLYVDDIIIISTNMNDINDTKKYLTLKLKMKNLNEIDITMGV
jgi:hypothetical protein